jgi:hypothetical protein
LSSQAAKTAGTIIRAKQNPPTFRRVLREKENSLTEFSALHPSATQQLAVLLLRHALAALLDH